MHLIHYKIMKPNILAQTFGELLLRADATIDLGQKVSYSFCKIFRFYTKVK